MGLVFRVGNSFKSNLRPLVIIFKVYLSLVYSYQFLLKYLRLSLAKSATSFSSSVYYHEMEVDIPILVFLLFGILVAVVAAALFLVLTSSVSVPILVLVPRVLRESTQVFWALERGTVWLKRTFRCNIELYICSNTHRSLL